MTDDGDAKSDAESRSSPDPLDDDPVNENADVRCYRRGECDGEDRESMIAANA